MVTHTKRFGIYHWDTFDNETFQIGEEDTLEKAVDFVINRYGIRIGPFGADQVDIVDLQGNIIQSFKVG